MEVCVCARARVRACACVDTRLAPRPCNAIRLQKTVATTVSNVRRDGNIAMTTPTLSWKEPLFSPPCVALAPSNELPIGRTLISPVAHDSPSPPRVVACLWPISWSATRRCLVALACALLTVHSHAVFCVHCFRKSQVRSGVPCKRRVRIARYEFSLRRPN